ncbi:hypothetical protein [Paraburkholderia susongensis]|uniref:Uncharacterized protein n=1 Tax=Paraburkholderia susongensis TaxID=1515439 RepID=A0A1X7M254_9BURK|nr:hypothetical protein [Paraburkholderia susongensis]SMG59613.1 hypothetical protein SAMN06265784_113133 [Paraburkholderia susongensis]
MKLVTYRRDGRRSFGAVKEQGVVDLAKHLTAIVDLKMLMSSPIANEA